MLNPHNCPTCPVPPNSSTKCLNSSWNFENHMTCETSGANHKIAYTTHTRSHGSTDLGPPKITLGHLLLPKILVGHCKNFNDYTA